MSWNAEKSFALYKNSSSQIMHWEELMLLILKSLSSCPFSFGLFVLRRIPAGRDNLNPALFAGSKHNAVRRLNLHELLAYRDEILHLIAMTISLSVLPGRGQSMFIRRYEQLPKPIFSACSRVRTPFSLSICRTNEAPSFAL